MSSRLSEVRDIVAVYLKNHVGLSILKGKEKTIMKFCTFIQTERQINFEERKRRDV